MLQYLEAWKGAYSRHYRWLQERTEVANLRLLRNHAQLGAAISALRVILPFGPELEQRGLEFVADMTRKRAIVASADHPIVDQFWRIFEYLSVLETDATSRPLNNHRDYDNWIAVSLPQFFERCRNHGQTPPTLEELRRHLPTSKTRKYVEQKLVNAPDGKRLHCWIFQQASETTDD